jgi:hypothetical protein
MPIEVHWEDETQTMVRFEIFSPFTWEDIRAGVQAEFRLLDTVNHTAGILFDARGAKTLPPGALPTLQELIALVHPNEGLKVIVGGGVVYKLFVTVFGIIAANNRELVEDYRFTESIEEAYGMLRAARDAG